MQDINNKYDALKTREDRIQYIRHGRNLPSPITRFTLLISGKELCNLYNQEFFRNLDKMEVAFVHSDVFNKDFNLGFHEPKKDQCLTCDKFKNM